MIDVEEHVYSDDPRDGHADVRTYLKDVSYFFIGNGLIRAAVQFSPAGEGSSYGLLVEDPRKLGPKRAALTMDHQNGLGQTRLSIIDMETGENIESGSVSADWTEVKGVPAVEINWGSAELKVCETFFCPDNKLPRLIRRVRIVNPGLRLIALYFFFR